MLTFYSHCDMRHHMRQGNRSDGASYGGVVKLKIDVKSTLDHYHSKKKWKEGFANFDALKCTGW